MSDRDGSPGDQAGATNNSDPIARTDCDDTPKGYRPAEDLRARFDARGAAMDGNWAVGDLGLTLDAEAGDPAGGHEFDPPVGEVQSRGYGEAVQKYRNAGWLGVLPLPPRSKALPPPGHTGHDGEWPDDDQYAEWQVMYPYDANLCLRLPECVIGIDVDHYDSKSGGQTLVEAEKRWGALPDAPMSTSRDDGVSGIRLYRVPAGTVLRDEITFAEMDLAHIDIIQHHHRYSVAWPSVHPTTGQRYV